MCSLEMFIMCNSSGLLDKTATHPPKNRHDCETLLGRKSVLCCLAKGCLKSSIRPMSSFLPKYTVQTCKNGLFLPLTFVLLHLMF